MADCTQKNCVAGAQVIEPVFRHHAVRTAINLAAPIEIPPRAGKSETLSGSFEHANSLRHDFKADPVTGDHCNFVVPGSWHWQFSSKFELAKSAAHRTGRVKRAGDGDNATRALHQSIQFQRIMHWASLNTQYACAAARSRTAGTRSNALEFTSPVEK
jgi:hypothetical protein